MSGWGGFWVGFFVMLGLFELGSELRRSAAIIADKKGLTIEERETLASFWSMCHTLAEEESKWKATREYGLWRKRLALLDQLRALPDATPERGKA